MNETKPSKQADVELRGKTNVPGQNPKQNDAPDQTVYHDENRRNQYDPEVGEALKVDIEEKKKKQ